MYKKSLLLWGELGMIKEIQDIEERMQEIRKSNISVFSARESTAAAGTR